MVEITLPHNWEPRPYQQNLWRALVGGTKRAVAVWARRSGKNIVATNWMACAAIRRPANYLFVLPQQNEARKAMWDAVDPHTGIRRIDAAFPKAIVARQLENAMSLTLVNGSTIQFGGSDNYSAYIGSSYAGIVFDEWSLSNPDAFPYLSPMLEENQGWAMFIGTPRGTENHFRKLADLASESPDWFYECLSAHDTGVFSEEQLAKIKAELIAQNGEVHGTGIFNQEYLCSWQSAIPESYWGREMEQAESEGRITNVPYDPKLPVHVSFDIGFDGCAMWFMQLSGQQIWAIDYYENSNEGMDHYAKVLKEKPYVYGQMVFPHDAGHREFVSGHAKTRIEILRDLGFNGRVLPQHALADGINSVRMMLPRVYFDRTKCKQGIACLRNYKRQWNAKTKVFNDHPVHDSYSHGADAMRYFAMGNVRNIKKQTIIYTDKGII